MDRGDDRAEARVGLETGVHQAGGQVGSRRHLHSASASSRSARVRMPMGSPLAATRHRLLIARQQLDRRADRLAGRDHGEGRLEHLGHLGVEHGRVADRVGQQPALAHRSDDAVRVVRRHHGELRDAVLVQQPHHVAHAAEAVDLEQIGRLLLLVLVRQQVADGPGGAALEEAVLGHPGVVEDLRQIRAAAVGEDHRDHRIWRRGRAPPRAPRGARCRRSRRRGCPRCAPAVAWRGTSRGRKRSCSDRPPTGRRSTARSPPRRPPRGTASPVRRSRSSRPGQRRSPGSAGSCSLM